MLPRTRKAIRIAAVTVVIVSAFPFLMWFLFPYPSYRLYMAWLGTGVTEGYAPLAPELAQALAPRYSYDLSAVRAAHTVRLPEHLAVADCATIYFGNGEIFRHVKDGVPLTARELRLLAHELTHGEQCERWGGRRAFAKKWFAQANAQAWAVVRSGGGPDALAEWLRTRYIKGLHDAMPMEEEGDGRARDVLDALP